MKFILEWQPVIQPIDLSEYTPAMSGQSISVCVNPAPEFMEERSEILHEFRVRFSEYSSALALAKDGTQEALEQTVLREFTEWSENKFTPALHEWCARLFSYGEDKYTAADVAEYGRVDPHFLNWLMHRAIEMIDEHKSGRKKNSAPR